MENYTLKRGMNLGSGSILNDGFNESMQYNGTMKNLSNDIDLLWEGLRSTNYLEIIQNNTYYQEWLDYCEENDIETSRQDTFNKIMEVVDDNTRKQVNQYVANKISLIEKPLSHIENLFEECSNNGKPSPINVSSNKANLDERVLLLHNIPGVKNADELNSRKELGLIASEWFGKLESRQEDRFCCSFVKSLGVQPKDNTDQDKQLTFIVDTEVQELRKLLHLDLFQYSRKKRAGDLSSYTEEEQKNIEALLEWSPTAGYVAEKNPTWSAIPGGIPSKYIIGIIAQGYNPETDAELLKQIGDKFNVPVMDPSLNILYKNQNQEQDKEENNQTEDAVNEEVEEPYFIEDDEDEIMLKFYNDDDENSDKK